MEGEERMLLLAEGTVLAKVWSQKCTCTRSECQAVQRHLRIKWEGRGMKDEAR